MLRPTPLQLAARRIQTCDANQQTGSRSRQTQQGGNQWIVSARKVFTQAWEIEWREEKNIEQSNSVRTAELRCKDIAKRV